VKGTLFLVAWTSQVLVFGLALMELLEVIKGFGPWKFLKFLGFTQAQKQTHLLVRPQEDEIWFSLRLLFLERG
jgi:hypothetical protein